MRDYIFIGPTPSAEDCQQVGTDQYDPTMARAECRAYLHQLRRVYGPEPEGAVLKIKSNPHEFGSYLEVVCEYDDRNETAVEYAFNCENGTENWDDEAKAELKGVANV